MIGILGVVHTVQVLATLLIPTLYADVIDHGVLVDDIGHVISGGGLMLALTVLQVCCAAWAVRLSAGIAMNLGNQVRTDVFAQVQRFSGLDVARFGVASLLTRTTNDVQLIQMLVFTALAISFPAPLIGIGGVALALGQSVSLSAVLAVELPILVAVIGFVIGRMIPHATATQRHVDRVNKVMREQIIGTRVIRAFVRTTHEQRRFADAVQELTAAGVRTGRLQVFFGATAILISTLAAVVVIGIGGPRVAAGQLEPGTLIAVLSYLALALNAVMVAMGVFIMLPAARASAVRIGEVLTTTPSIIDPVAPDPSPSGPGQLELSGVSFGYPGAEEPAVRDVDLVARPGRLTAVVGSTGSGKTTLVKLIARLLDTEAGTLSIDGTDVHRMRRSDLVRLVGLVPQQPFLFSGTVAFNLRYGNPDATDDELWHSLEVAQARDFVEAMPGGLDAAVGQGGCSVSGGQRQRLAIARVLVAKPRIYLFDDAFSALDAATEAALRQALTTEIGHATQVDVSQQVSTVHDADHIIVLSSGRVEAAGTHQELLAASSTYAELVSSQLSSWQLR
ncbi:ABC transporter ATP-binding protein [Kribbella sp. DT2]|uniref:ABC transporter ATP-binding protein n=1 Tax=Kribbella sp. DT2 TaxID=3393427 RepID=UPI003CFA64D2